MKDSCAINRRNLKFSSSWFAHPFIVWYSSFNGITRVSLHSTSSEEHYKQAKMITVHKSEDEAEISRICLVASESLIDYISLSVLMPTFFQHISTFQLFVQCFCKFCKLLNACKKSQKTSLNVNFEMWEDIFRLNSTQSWSWFHKFSIKPLSTAAYFRLCATRLRSVHG